jgi:hypothetical protein
MGRRCDSTGYTKATTSCMYHGHGHRHAAGHKGLWRERGRRCRRTGRRTVLRVGETGKRRQLVHLCHQRNDLWALWHDCAHQNACGIRPPNTSQCHAHVNTPKYGFESTINAREGVKREQHSRRRTYHMAAPRPDESQRYQGLHSGRDTTVDDGYKR